MVLKTPAMTNEVASGSDHPPPHTQEQASGTDVCFNTSIQVETSAIDLCMAEEIAAYEDDLAFIEKQTEAKRRKNANHRVNLRFRTWEAWERVHMVREDQNTWLRVPQDGDSSASRVAAEMNPPAVNSLREHILRIAARCQQQSEQQQRAIDLSLPRTPEALRSASPVHGETRSEPPTIDGIKQPSTKKRRVDSYVLLEDFVINQYTTPAVSEPCEATVVERKHPQPRAACYDRRTPRLHSRISHDSTVKPPYGIDLISAWKQRPYIWNFNHQGLQRQN